VLRIHGLYGVDSDPEPRIHASDLWIRIRILLFSSLTFKTPTKNKLKKSFSAAYYFLKINLHHFSKIKSKKKSQISRMLNDRRIRIRIHTSDEWIRIHKSDEWIRIQEAQKRVDPDSDPDSDPQH
jgi:hypothetical protein